MRYFFKFIVFFFGCGALYSTTYEMPIVVVKGKKIPFKQIEDISTTETIQNGFKMISSRNIDQETMQVYVDGIPVQNGGLPINLALFDSVPTTSHNQGLGEIIYASKKPKKGQHLNVAGQFGSYNTYKAMVTAEGGTEKTQGSITVSQNGMNGIQTFASRLQTIPALKERDKEVRNHIKARIDHQTGNFEHTLCGAFHDGDFTYKNVPVTDFDLNHSRWQAKEQLSILKYEGIYTTKERTHSFLMGFAHLARKDSSEDVKNVFTDKNFYITQNNKFVVNNYYATDINLSFLKSIYKSDYAKNQLSHFNVENNHHVTISKTKGTLHIKGIGMNTPDRHLNAMISVQQNLSSQVSLFGKVGYYHRLPLMAQKYHPKFKNPNLKSEKALSTEVGYMYLQSCHTVKQSLFYIYITDYIDLLGSRYESARYFKTLGIENEYTYTQNQWQWGGRYIYAIMKSDKKSFYARKPKHKADLNVSYQHNEQLTINGSVRYFGNHVDINAENYNDPLKDCSGVVTANVRLQYQYSKNVKTLFGVDNILNKKYEFPSGYKAGGFFVYVGFDIRITSYSYST